VVIGAANRFSVLNEKEDYRILKKPDSFSVVGKENRFLSFTGTPR